MNPKYTNKANNFRELDRLLGSRKGHTIIDLMERLNLGRRAILKYISEIQNTPYNAKMDTDAHRGKEKIYKYADPDFSIYRWEKKDELRKKLSAAIDSLTEYENHPMFLWLKSCLIDLDSDGALNSRNMISFESNKELRGLEYLHDLLDAISDRYPIKLTYKPYSSDERLLYVHPYHLKQYNNRWFLIGRPEDRDVLHNYAVDRIVDVKPLDKKYIDTDVDFEEYFEDVVGVTVNEGNVEEVKILVSRKRYPYIESKPIHYTQFHIEAEDTPDFVCLSYEMKLNRELEALLLSYGPDVVVLAPQSLRDSIAEKVRKLAGLYG